MIQPEDGEEIRDDGEALLYCEWSQYFVRLNECTHEEIGCPASDELLKALPRTTFKFILNYNR
jgi:hypothetical protein